jgi:dihydrolipoamide dehydrogenase
VAGEVIAARALGRPSEPRPQSRFSAAEGHRALPQVTFTDPEVGSVGLTERQAREAGIDVETAEYDMAALAGTYLLRDDYAGRAKLVIDRSDDTLVGATFVGSGVADLARWPAAAVAVPAALVGNRACEGLAHRVPPERFRVLVLGLMVAAAAVALAAAV